MTMNMYIVMTMNIYINDENTKWLKSYRERGGSMSGVVNNLLERHIHGEIKMAYDPVKKELMGGVVGDVLETTTYTPIDDSGNKVIPNLGDVIKTTDKK